MLEFFESDRIESFQMMKIKLEIQSVWAYVIVDDKNVKRLRNLHKIYVALPKTMKFLSISSYDFQTEPSIGNRIRWVPLFVGVEQQIKQLKFLSWNDCGSNLT